MSTHKECIAMINQQLRTGDVLLSSVLELYKTIPRVDFIPKPYESFAYSDMQIQLPHNQRMMTPLEEASLLQSLNLKGTEVILEVGTGTGFLTAMLSRMAKKVISVDYYSDFTKIAQTTLDKHNVTNVELIHGDACRGWLDKAPYDVMVFTGPIEEITETHRLQLLPGGKLFVIVGANPIMQAQLHELDHNGNWSAQLIFETCLPPLINKLKSKEFVF